MPSPKRSLAEQIAWNRLKAKKEPARLARDVENAALWESPTRVGFQHVSTHLPSAVQDGGRADRPGVCASRRMPGRMWRGCHRRVSLLGWKKQYERFLVQREETKNLPRYPHAITRSPTGDRLNVVFRAHEGWDRPRTRLFVELLE